MSRFTVSGPAVDKTYPSAGAALSAAITAAEHHRGEATFYVRDGAGSCVGRVDRSVSGETRVYRFGKAVA